jgi:hypothetical protein
LVCTDKMVLPFRFRDNDGSTNTHTKTHILHLHSPKKNAHVPSPLIFLFWLYYRTIYITSYMFRDPFYMYTCMHSHNP